MNQNQFITMVLSWERDLESKKQSGYRYQSNARSLNEPLSYIKERISKRLRHLGKRRNRKPIYHY